MNGIKKNIGYQTLYQLLITALPIITAPYLARVLGAVQQGVYSYTSSIVNYFTLFAMLGIINHGTRSIASTKNSEQEKNRTFRTIYLIQLCTSLGALFLYAIYVLCLCKENSDIAFIQILSLVACVFDINWFYFGLEEFKVTVTRNCVIKIITVALILLLVNKPSDLWIYAVLMTGSVVVSNLVLWILLPKYLKAERIKIINIKSHVKDILVLFVPLLAMSIYHIMDKTMLGMLSTYENSGYYYNADKIINIPVGVLTGVSTVLFPRMVSLLSSNDESTFNSVFSKSVEGVGLLAVAMAFGMAAVSNEFTPIFFGTGFEPCIMLIIVLAPVLVIKAISITIRYQYLIPKKKEKIFILSVVCGALSNLFANLALIPSLGAMGAVIGTLIAESVACILQIFFIKNEVKIVKALGTLVPYICFGFVMYVSVRMIAHLNVSGVIGLMAEICVGGCVFLALCLAYVVIAKDKTILFQIVPKVRRKK